jgi:hypothetical protein
MDGHELEGEEKKYEEDKSMITILEIRCFLKKSAPPSCSLGCIPYWRNMANT